MRVNSEVGVQHATFDGETAGEGLAVFFSQDGEALARYRCLVKAITSQGTYDVGEFYISPPKATPLPGRLSRMVAAAVCPGVQSWAVDISAIPSNDELEIPPETAEIILTSSKCCTAPVGVTRVAERYNYIADTSPGGFSSFKVRAGMHVTGITAFGLSGGGEVDLGGSSTITVPAGVSINLEPGSNILPPNNLITLSNVDWVIEYLESA